MEFSFSISPSCDYSWLISCRIDWFDLFAVQGTLESSPAPLSCIKTHNGFLHSSTEEEHLLCARNGQECSVNLVSECSGVLWLELSRTARVLEKKLKHPSNLVKSPLLLPTVSSAGTGRFEYRKPGTLQGCAKLQV